MIDVEKEILAADKVLHIICQLLNNASVQIVQILQKIIN